VRIRIADHQREALRIGRPFVALQPSLDLGQLKRLAAAAIQQPHLVALRLAGTGRSERQILAVRAEAGRRLALGAGRNLALVLAVEADGPDMSVAGLVFLDVNLRDDEGDALAVRGALRVAHLLQLAEIVERERTLRALRRRKAG